MYSNGQIFINDAICVIQSPHEHGMERLLMHQINKKVAIFIPLSFHTFVSIDEQHSRDVLVLNPTKKSAASCFNCAIAELFFPLVRGSIPQRQAKSVV